VDEIRHSAPARQVTVSDLTAVFVRRVGLSRKRTFREVLRWRERAHGCRLDEHPLHLKADIVRIEFIGRHRAIG
jgi:hypothetical protein